MTRPHPAPGGPVTGGTAEQRWREWLPGRPWPALEVRASWRRVGVCAAHPDDDVLAVGGLLARLAAGGARLGFLAATDGEASHPGSAVLAPEDLAHRRIAETGDALAELGVRPDGVTRLGLPDGGLSAAGAALTRAVGAFAAGVDVLLAPWDRDAHPDHDALGRAAVAAAAAAGVPLLAFPVWAWHWAQPGDERVPWHRVRRVALDAGERAAKRAAMGKFVTQVRPLGPGPREAAVLPPEVLAHFDRDLEVVFA